MGRCLPELSAWSLRLFPAKFLENVAKGGIVDGLLCLGLFKWMTNHQVAQGSGFIAVRRDQTRGEVWDIYLRGVSTNSRERYKCAFASSAVETRQYFESKTHIIRG